MTSDQLMGVAAILASAAFTAIAAGAFGPWAWIFLPLLALIWCVACWVDRRR
jgi:hypothetical protein